jgi:acetate kinase
MSTAILTLNAGSSTLKFGVFGDTVGEPALLRGDLEVGDAPADFSDALAALLRDLTTRLPDVTLLAVGHRVVHGGAEHVSPEAITPRLLATLRGLVPLDPLHMPRNLAPIEALAQARPDLLQVACFDTAFHHTMPAVAQRFGLPRAMSASGLRRYGFHGLSYEYIAGKLAQVAPGLHRVVVAHLGAGASLCALLDGRSIATTTGFSALDGLLMATRCGSLDPGVILHLGRQGLSFAAIEDLLYRQSGLLGVSGISGDIRVLLASDAPGAREAIELFIYRVALEAGAMAAALGGLDGLVFSAGIGEHAASIRAAICARLAWLGLRLDSAANAADAACISSAASPVAIHVIPTDEEAMVAQHTRAIMARKTAA